VRTLVLIRHSKTEAVSSQGSSQGSSRGSSQGSSQGDRARRLTDRGRRDAAAIGAWLHAEGIRPDVVVSSPAARAVETWEHAAPALRDAPDVDEDRRVYEASVDDLLAVVHELPDEAEVAVIVGHAPGLPALAGTLVDLTTGGIGDPDALSALADNMPTSGIAVIELDGSWADAAPGSGRLVKFAAPRA
jgi:phosphohistidine phosphatase